MENTCQARGWVYRCAEPADSGSLCHWHSSARKTKAKIESAVRAGKPLEGANLEGADLSGADLSGGKFVEANFRGATLNNAVLSRADLWRADLTGAHLRNARMDGCQLMEATFDGADLQGATLDECRVSRASFNGSTMVGVSFRGTKHLDDASLLGAKWEPDKKNVHEQRGDYETAIQVYSSIKQASIGRGDHIGASDFHFREMECRRKASRTPPFERVRLTAHWLFWGYAERPSWVFRFALAAVVLLAVIYFALDGISGAHFAECLYFSATSFTALGYGSWVASPENWARALGVFEAALGVATVSSFIVSLTRKVTR